MAKEKKASHVLPRVSFSYPPVVAVLGHVDHGKTSLLDVIRKTGVAEKEHGGITQRIGASSVEIVHDSKKRRITFIDTPGHEAFLRMRSRGARVADLVLLVISSVDGVMPQTKESISILKESNLPFIVVLTKKDIPEKNIEKIKQQLEKEDILLEGRGGATPIIEVSAKTGENISALLDLILLFFDMQKEGKEDQSSKNLRAIVIESWLDAKSGPRATVVVKSGALRVRDTVFCEGQQVRIRALVNDKGKNVDLATLGDAIEILGFAKTPTVGSSLIHEKESKIDSLDSLLKKTSAMPLSYTGKKEEPVLAVILRSDTLGSLEAIINSIPAEVKIISSEAGEISDADILLAKSAKAIILGFNTIVREEVRKLAFLEKVPMKNYTIIYELLDEIRDVLAGRALAVEEKILGKAKILAKFPYEKTFVAGVAVVEGRIAKGDKARLVRGEDVVGESTITSLRQGKNPISKIETGLEAGAIISPFLDFTIGDMLISHG